MTGSAGKRWTFVFSRGQTKFIFLERGESEGRKWWRVAIEPEVADDGKCSSAMDVVVACVFC